jgi:hypothetical protein
VILLSPKADAGKTILEALAVKAVRTILAVFAVLQI